MKHTTLGRMLKKIGRTKNADSEEDEDQDDLPTLSASENVAHPPARLKAPADHLISDDIEPLNAEAQDYLIASGGLLKAVLQPSNHPSATARTIGCSLYPSPFPSRLFHEACELQTIFQDLYMAVSQNPEWLKEVLKDLIASDPLTSVLWSVHETVVSRGLNTGGNISAGLFRSDYMLRAESDQRFGLKQVEFNTVACAGSMHGQRVADMHRHLYRSGAYHHSASKLEHETKQKVELNIPDNDNCTGISNMLKVMHEAYLQQSHPYSQSLQLPACILMIVQPNNFNIADERPIEYALWSRNPPIPCFRCLWGDDILELTSLELNGTLIFQPNTQAETYEVSVVYFRAGFEPFEYEDSVGHEVRVRIEMSNAVKCPNILTQLAGYKKVQQALCNSQMLDQFVGIEHGARLRHTFMEIYPLDSTESGAKGRVLAQNIEHAHGFVLKPSREGGGHNVYREAIPSFLEDLPQYRWPEYVLMEMIEPVIARNALVSSRGIWLGDVVAELGIWGGCVWLQQGSKVEVIANQQLGWSVRSKIPTVNEISVVKGYGCFDSLALSDE